MWWSAGGWQVTPYGLEQVAGHAAISGAKLAEFDISGQLRWIGIMDQLGADLDAFLPAFSVALALHGYADLDPALVPVSAKTYRKNLRRLAYEAAAAAKAKKAKRREAAM